MTEHSEHAQRDNSAPPTPKQSSRRSFAPVVHDATVKRRLHPTAASASRARAQTRTRIPARLSSASIPSRASVSSATRHPVGSAATPQTVPNQNGSKAESDVPVGQLKPSASTVLTRTIEDLEGLLNEALVIARVAADDHEADLHVCGFSRAH